MGLQLNQKQENMRTGTNFHIKFCVFYVYFVTFSMLFMLKMNIKVSFFKIVLCKPVTSLYLIPRLQDLLRVGEERNELVGVLDFDGCASGLSYLVGAQPLKARGANRVRGEVYE